MNQEPCIFCINPSSKKSLGIESERILHEYEFWWLVLQLEEKRRSTKQSAGMLISKRHIENASLANSLEAAELIAVIKDSANKLCEATNTTYTNQETIGFNQGSDAGQTVMHAHVHILPVSESDPSELKVRGGIGGAFEALRRERLS
jgi:diadenosine tetraphosphate (Ap4A) HIT family hydrolase